MKVLARCLLTCSLFIGQSAIAAMPVEVVNTTPDTVGQRLVYAIKEGIRSSTSLSLSFDEAKPRMQVAIVTLDPDDQHLGYSSVYSVVLVWNNPAQIYPFYLTQYVGICGSSRVRECADGLVANISEQSDNLLKLFQKFQKNKQ